ncbi:MAG: T9SS type A sorting domain-containing protein [Bacteroidetes bacterium]|nr:T9SS type A sorting domain-containing protein [Bacteroidota bacterium]
MKKLKRIQLSNKLKAYSTMAMALTAGQAGLNAGVVYTDIDDVNIGVGDFFDIDINGDGILDFHFEANAIANGSATWSFGSVFGNATSVSVGNPDNQLLGYVGYYYNYASALNYMDSIGPAGPWLSNPSYGNSAVLASNFYDVATYGAFPGAGAKFLGYKFTIDGNIHFGWMRIIAEIEPLTITITEYAYDDMPRTPILIDFYGSISALPEGAVTIYSFGTMLTILNKINLENAFANVVDLSGKQIKSYPINAGLNQIELDNVASGNYLIQIVSNQGNTSKQVFIN